MNRRLSVLFASMLAMAVTVSSAVASTVDYSFQFLNGATVVASGSFSYESSKTGLLNFGDLSFFSISGASNYYSLADVTGPLNAYNYFGYDADLKKFVPGIVDGPQGQIALIFGAISGDASGATRGFFFDPLPSQADLLNNGGNDGLYAFFDPTNVTNGGASPSDYPSFTSFTITPVPEPSTWLMMILGLVGIGFFGARRPSHRTSTC